MNILRAFQIIDQDGTSVVSSTYNVVNESGDLTQQNVKDSFYAVDEELKGHINAIRTFIETKRLAER